jgi:multicomponent Na+:H+ antiporter subunit F
MTPETFLELCVQISLGLVCAAFFIAFLRLVRGPTLSDRVLALDMLVTVGIGFIAVLTVRTGYAQYLDVAIGLGLVGFLATVAFARYIIARGSRPDRRERRSPGMSSRGPAQMTEDAE